MSANKSFEYNQDTEIGKIKKFEINNKKVEALLGEYTSNVIFRLITD